MTHWFFKKMWHCCTIFKTTLCVEFFVLFFIVNLNGGCGRDNKKGLIYFVFFGGELGVGLVLVICILLQMETWNALPPPPQKKKNSIFC